VRIGTHERPLAGRGLRCRGVLRRLDSGANSRVRRFQCVSGATDPLGVIAELANTRVAAVARKTAYAFPASRGLRAARTVVIRMNPARFAGQWIAAQVAEAALIGCHLCTLLNGHAVPGAIVHFGVLFGRTRVTPVPVAVKLRPAFTFFRRQARDALALPSPLLVTHHRIAALGLLPLKEFFAVGDIVRPRDLPLTRLLLFWGHARPAVLFARAAGLTFCSTGHSSVYQLRILDTN
jgi:hypothetical protein